MGDACGIFLPTNSLIFLGVKEVAGVFGTVNRTIFNLQIQRTIGEGGPLGLKTPAQRF